MAYNIVLDRFITRMITLYSIPLSGAYTEVFAALAYSI